MGRKTTDFAEKLNNSYEVAESGCWEVTKYSGYRSGEGYARIPHRVDGVRYKLFAHVESYRLNVGDIPTDYEVDHKCFNIICINPDHLEAVTRGVNASRRRR